MATYLLGPLHDCMKSVNDAARFVTPNQVGENQGGDGHGQRKEEELGKEANINAKKGDEDVEHIDD